MNYPKTWHGWTPWLALAMGVIGFWIWGGSHTLAPGHLGWIMAGLDTPGHYEGWQFFRHSTWWQWPLGNNPADGSDAPGTIILSDSIPLVAIPLKILSPWLPQNFQYLGLWAFSCFLLQAWFSCKLLGRLTDDTVVRLVGTAFFLSATIFLLRVYMHPALSAQWSLIAGMYLIFDVRFRSRAWLVLLCVVVLIHAYLFVMLGALWIADLIQRLWRKEVSFKKLALHMSGSMVIVFLLMEAAGYFAKGPSLFASVRGHLDLFFPLWTGVRYFGEWSWLIPGSNMDFLAYDGFGYLGVGFIALLLVSILVTLSRQAGKVVGIGIEPKPASAWAVLCVTCAILFVYAVGNKVYFSQRLLFSYELPGWLDWTYDLFRASARMMWPAWYLSLLAVFYLLLRTLPVRYVRYLVLIALLVQLGDLSKAVVDTRAWALKNRTWHSTMVDPIWSEIAAHYQHLAFVQPAGVPGGMLTFVPSYRAVTNYAAINNMTINIAYLARLDEKKLAAARASRVALLKRGLVEPGTFYVIEDSQLWPQLICLPKSSSWYGIINGLHVVVPAPLPGLAALPRATCGAQ